MIMASQEHVEMLTSTGREILAHFIEIVAGSYPEIDDPMMRDRHLGRELGMALFLAARGDEEVNRTLLVNGLGIAIGECVAQQATPLVAQTILDSLNEGIVDGAAFANEAFGRAGQA